MQQLIILLVAPVFDKSKCPLGKKIYTKAKFHWLDGEMRTSARLTKKKLSPVLFSSSVIALVLGAFVHQ